MKATIAITMAAVLLCAHAASASSDVTFDLSSAKLVWGADGLWKSCFDKVTLRERLAKPAPLATLRRDGQTLPASRLERDGESLLIWFGDEQNLWY